MSHRSTALSQLRESDRLRQRTRRQRLKDQGVPLPHVVDNAVTEAMSFALAMALGGKTGVGAQPKVQTISITLVFETALDILTKRMRYPDGPAALALKARLSKREVHSDSRWVPHFPSCKPSFTLDMSTPK